MANWDIVLLVILGLILLSPVEIKSQNFEPVYLQGDPGERGPIGPRGPPGQDGRPVSTYLIL